MSREAPVVEISSESDSENECNVTAEGIGKIELIDDDDDDEVQIVEEAGAVAKTKNLVDDDPSGNDVKKTDNKEELTKDDVVEISEDDDDVLFVLPVKPAPAKATSSTLTVATKSDAGSQSVIASNKQTYFAPKNGLLSPWRKCRIVSEASNAYRVRFHGEKSVSTFPRYQIAADSAPPGQLKSETRVIAVQSSIEDVDYFYAGVIGEITSKTNNYEYLVFFDNGRALYVSPSLVRVVNGEDKWSHVHQNARKFMEYLFEGTEPNGEQKKLPIIKDALDTRMTVECNGKWKFGKIANTQGRLLIQIEYEGYDRTEWLYRGSPRLGPIWRQYVKLKEANPEVSLIETYSSMDEDSSIESDGDTRDASGVRTPSTKSKNPFKKLIPANEKLYCSPFEYTTHDCGPECCAFDAKPSKSLKRYSPLALPMIMGFERIVQSRKVTYTTPCGKIKRNMYDLRRYLQEIECKLLDVDNFSYEPQVDCMRMYKTNERYILNKDLSNGLELKPILVTNGFNRKMPDKFTYVAEMCLNQSVPNFLKENVESMAGCDCEDDCYNRHECPCWQLTLDGMAFADKPEEKIGYNYKRLDSPTFPAIFECNPNCKCSKKCSNRVAQLPMEQSFELFRTGKCGWGVRCLHDLPSGAFICCYFGDLMTEGHIEHVAKKQGDTYLAVLDFIEWASNEKEGYEPQALMSPDDLCTQSRSDTDRADGRPPAKKARTSRKQRSSESPPDLSIAGSSSYIENEPVATVINYFPRFETNTESHPTRQFYGRTETAYVIDGKRNGNIGRFFNHCCEPNMFVQNVFIDTHDLRFPRLALFTNQAITAGTELRWDYNYVVGSIANRRIICECGARHCRGRLL